MRLRNIPRAEGVIQMHRTVIKRPEDQRGCWHQVFGDRHPIYIEIGMGKGQFILNMAKAHPDVNFIGIERYSSVLLRALEKFDTEEYEALTNIRFVCMDARNVEDPDVFFHRAWELEYQRKQEMRRNQPARTKKKSYDIEL